MSSYSPLGTNVCAVKYADDVTIILPVSKENFSDMSSFHAEVEHFENWCLQHQMKINHAKTKVLNVNFSPTPLPICSNLDNTYVLKMLGVLFDVRLSWSTHFDFIVKKASQRLYVLRILKPLLCHDNLVTIFHALIQSLLDYASPVFLNAGSSLDSSFVVLCKRAFRIIHGPDKYCKSCDFLQVYRRRLHLSMKLFDQALSSPSHVLHDLIPPFSTRSARIILPFVRTSRRAKGFFFHCSVVRNSTL